MLDSKTQDPLRLYVAWHSSAKAGPPLARRLLRWLSQPADELLETGMGFPVVYVSKDGDGHPGVIPLHKARRTALALLVEENMAADPVWRTWMESLPDELEVFPIVIGRAASMTPARIANLNAITVGGEGPGLTPEGRRELLTIRLTEALARQVLGTGDLLAPAVPGEELRRMRVFISHAKLDGTPVASAVRSAIYAETQMRAFYDETDLAYGGPWMRQLEQHAKTQSAAFVCVLSDAYAGRPWCRREANLARHPQPHAASQGSKTWTLPPTVLVDDLQQAQTRLFDEFGGLRIVRWNPGGVRLILAHLVREILFTGLAELRALEFESQVPAKHVALVGWFPTRATLTSLVIAAKERGAKVPRAVIHPGRRLSQPEEDSLLSGVEGLQKLVCFDEYDFMTSPLLS